MQSLVKDGKVSRGYLGVGIEEVNKETLATLKMSDIHGALVNGVSQGSAADRAGIKSGDVISKVNGEKVKNVQDLRMKISSNPPGKTITVTLIREPGKTTVQAVKLDDLKNMRSLQPPVRNNLMPKRRR